MSYSLVLGLLVMFVFTDLFLKGHMTWKSYRHRFLPWILLNWNQRARRVEEAALTATNNQYPAATPDLLYRELTQFLSALDERLTNGLCPASYAESHFKASFQGDTSELCRSAEAVALQSLGFNIKRQPSRIPQAGRGVVVTKGRVEANRLVALYPGLIYRPGEPVLFQSLGNQFVFRCQDGVIVDGNDRHLSKYLYKSCAGRDVRPPHLLCDMSWLTESPVNPLAVGQYVNNSDQNNVANVEYQELTLDSSFPPELLKYVPNTYYQSATTSDPWLRRLVVLRSLRTISAGEELFSTYFTLV